MDIIMILLQIIKMILDNMNKIYSAISVRKQHKPIRH
jgi:hypothetical protein